jgi:hypothetical protein
MKFCQPRKFLLVPNLENGPRATLRLTIKSEYAPRFIYIPANCKQLEEQLQAQLHGTVSTGTEDRVTSRLVWCGAPATEKIRYRRIAFIANAKAARRSVRICKVRMVENVEELRPKLRGEPLMQRE